MNAKPHLRVGFVGSGFAAAFHFAALQRLHSVEVEAVGVFSPTPEKRERFAAARGIRAFDHLEELLAAVDVVHVCAPPALHEEVAIRALTLNKYPIIEKPLTGYFGDGSADFDGFHAPKRPALEAVIASIRRLREAEQQSAANILYAENWVYAPAIQKEREIIEKTDAQILWMHGEEAHSGSHSATYGDWSKTGGGSMINKGCHPLTAVLYLKRVEGRVRANAPIRPRSVSGQTHILTRSPSYRDKSHLRTQYKDIEDFALMHVTFDDGTIADIFASEIVMGGVHNWLEVAANNHRTICNINPNNVMQTYNPVDAQFQDIYISEKIGTKQGWSAPSPDEDWFHGYYQEMEAFYRAIAFDEMIESDSALAADAMLTIYSAYLSAEQHGAAVEIPACY